jgi:hypothetical protein
MRAFWLLIKNRLSLPRPVAFAFRASLFSFGLLLVMPLEPLAIPAAFGGGLSFSLLLG